MVSELFRTLRIGWPLGQSLSAVFQISNCLAKLYINIYYI